MRQEGRQIVHDVQREREAVSKVVDCTRAEMAAEVRKLTDQAEAAERRCQTALSELTSPKASTDDERSQL